MRLMLAAVAALMLAACGVNVSTGGDGPGNAAPAGGGYRLEVRANDGVQIYTVTTPDGKTVGAQAADGASAMLQEDRIQALASNQPAPEDLPQVLSLKLPGVEMSVNAQPDENGHVGEDNDSAQVHINVAGQQTVSVDARDGGPGENDDSAHVVITGASAQDASDFIEKAEQLSPEVRVAFREAAGLSNTPPREND